MAAVSYAGTTIKNADDVNESYLNEVAFQMSHTSDAGTDGPSDVDH